MHELSLAMEVCRLAERVAAEQGERADRVRGVGVEIGREAGVEVESFRFCLGVLLRDPPFGSASAELIPLPGDVLRLAYVEVDDGHPDH